MGRFKKGVLRLNSGRTKVSHWKDIQGIDIPVLTACPRRVDWKKEMGDGWSEEDEDRLRLTRARIKERKRKSSTYSERGMMSAKEKITGLEASLKEMEAARDEKANWLKIQYDRCQFGVGPFWGMHYMHYNFGLVESIDKKTKKSTQHYPGYRVVDNLIFSIFQKGIDQSRGAIFPKRRRVGATWDLVAMVIWAMLFQQAAIIFGSYHMDDCKKFIQRCKKYIKWLPWFLKPDIIAQPADYIELKPNRLMCSVLGWDYDTISSSRLRTADTGDPKNFEGDTLSIMIIDEAGKTDLVKECVSMAEPALNDSGGLFRAGSIFLLGTVGEMTGTGMSFKRMFDSAAAYELDQYWIPGWMGVEMDKAGNDKEEKIIDAIKLKVKRLEDSGNIKDAIERRQQFPLSLKDCWLMDQSTHPVPIDVLEMLQDDYDNHHHKSMKYGILRFDKKNPGKVEFVRQEPRKSPGSKGNGDWPGYNQVTIFEHPLPSTWERPYAAGCDPIPFKKAQNGETSPGYIGSDISFTVVRRPFRPGDGPEPVPVAFYHGRPDDPKDAYMQALLLCIYYENCQINIEQNKGGGEMAAMFETLGYEHLLAYQVGEVSRSISTRNRNDYGFSNSSVWWVNMLGRMVRMMKNFRTHPCAVFLRLIQEGFFVGKLNADGWIGWMAAVQLADEYDALETRGFVEKEKKKEESYAQQIFEMNWAHVNGQIRNQNIADTTILYKKLKQIGQ